MNIESDILDSIVAQLSFNEKKNLFYIDSENEFITLSESTIDFINDRRTELINYFETVYFNNGRNNLIDLIIDRVLKVFYQSNQFIDFTSDNITELKQYYVSLLSDIYNHLTGTGEKMPDKIIRRHYNNLRFWISKTNPFVKVINSNRPFIVEVVCSEYTPEMQLSVLELDINSLKQPVLDIGCGFSANLVKYLRGKGIKAYGLDRVIKEEKEYYIKTDWLSYYFFPDSWGTVIAHMSFSNHFMHHHLRNDGNYVEYAKKYLQIINSLKYDGNFIYSPSISFVEDHIDKNKFSVSRKNPECITTKGKELGVTNVHRKYL